MSLREKKLTVNGYMPGEQWRCGGGARAIEREAGEPVAVAGAGETGGWCERNGWLVRRWTTINEDLRS